jgi:IPT/TIG domain
MTFGRRVVAGVVVAMLALGIGAVAPAVAATGVGEIPAPPRLPWHGGALHGAKAAVDTTVFAGYEVTTGAASVLDRFVVPSIDCAASAATSGIGPGAYMVAGPTGQEFDGADVSMECSDGSLLTGEYVIVNGSDTEYGDAVAPGDVIEASVSLTSTTTTVTIEDLTKADRFSVSDTGSGASGMAEFVGVDTLSGSTGVLPVPAVSAVKFFHAEAGGTTLGSARATPLALTAGCPVTLAPTAVFLSSDFRVEPPAISITALNPTNGTVGTPVTITGAGFTPTSKVRFNGVFARTVTYSSSTELQATVPATATTGPVTVINPSPPRAATTSGCTFTVTPSTAPTSADPGDLSS